MRILVITNLYPPEFLGGYELGCSQMVRALRGNGHDVRVVTSVSAHTSGSSESGVRRVLQLPPVHDGARMTALPRAVANHFHLLSNFVNAANTRAIREEIDDFEPDVAYVWNILGLGGIGVLTLLRDAGLAWVWHLMDVIPPQLVHFGGGGRQLGRELSRTFPGRYLVCSENLLGEILTLGTDLGSRVEIVPNWVDAGPIPPRTSFFAGGVLRMMTASGVLCEEKGTRLVIEIAAGVRERGFANFRIDVFGREEDPEFRRLLYTHGVEDVVRFMGPRPHRQLLDLLPEYDVFIFPTWSREPFGFAPLEAVAAGCVALFTEDCGLAEWLIDGVDCLKSPRDAAGFADRVTQILTGEIALEALARRGQHAVRRELTIDQVVPVVERALTDAANDRQPAVSTAAASYRLARFAEGVLGAVIQERLPA